MKREREYTVLFLQHKKKKFLILSRYTPDQLVPYLLLDLLEAVKHRDTWDAVNLAEGDQTYWIQTLLAGYFGKVDDGTSQVVHYHHSLVTLDGKLLLLKHIQSSLPSPSSPRLTPTVAVPS